MIHLEDENFNNLISSGKYIVDFYAQWCGPCKMMSPILEELSKNINIIKVDIDKHLTLTNNYKVYSVPTFIFFKDGKEITRVVGYHDKEELEDIYERLN